MYKSVNFKLQDNTIFYIIFMTVTKVIVVFTIFAFKLNLLKGREGSHEKIR